MFSLPLLFTGDDGASRWKQTAWEEQTRGGMKLTPQIGTSSLRLRTSVPGYTTDWHVAGDPVMIVVQRGVLRIELRDGTVRDFGPGQGFIAADRLKQDESFDPARHGHRARVIGVDRLEAVHIKLVDFESTKVTQETRLHTAALPGSCVAPRTEKTPTICGP